MGDIYFSKKRMIRYTAGRANAHYSYILYCTSRGTLSDMSKHFLEVVYSKIMNATVCLST